MHATVAMFPGQGSQTAEMRDIVEQHTPDLLELAVSLLGVDPLTRVDEGTRWAQPAIYCASLAGWRGAAEDVAAFAGHSLGEIAALAAAGALDERDGLRLVCARGDLMQRSEAAAAGSGMLALVGPGAHEHAAALRASGVELVNDNGREQIVVSGSAAALRRLTDATAGQRVRALRLPVAGAFHTAALRPEVEQLRGILSDVVVRPPSRPVYSSMLARPFDDPRRQLAEAIAAPVRWRETVNRLVADGIGRIIDVGPGKTLARLAAREHPKAIIVRSITAEKEEAAHVG